jgi:hypothetical protein
MTIAIALIPVVALLILVLFYVTFASTRAAQVAECRADHDRFTKAVLEEDARLQQALVVSLLEGQPLPDTLEAFQKRRAAMLPQMNLDDPAGWDADELERCARQQFLERVSEVNRRLGTRLAIAGTLLTGAAVVISAVLYHFGSTITPSPVYQPWTPPSAIAPPDPPPLSPAPTDSPPVLNAVPPSTTTPNATDGPAPDVDAAPS